MKRLPPHGDKVKVITASSQELPTYTNNMGLLVYVPSTWNYCEQRQHTKTWKLEISGHNAKRYTHALHTQKYLHDIIIHHNNIEVPHSAAVCIRQGGLSLFLSPEART